MIDERSRSVMHGRTGGAETARGGRSFTKDESKISHAKCENQIRLTGVGHSVASSVLQSERNSQAVDFRNKIRKTK